LMFHVIFGLTAKADGLYLNIKLCVKQRRLIQRLLRATETMVQGGLSEDVLQTEDGGWRSVVGGGQLRNHAATPNSVWMN
jgi:hypothetical protein